MRALRLAIPILILGMLAAGASSAHAADVQPRGGELRIAGPDGLTLGVCPLKHTEVQADIDGFIGRVRVRQTFQNPLEEKIEAVYVFPLPADAAVDEMVMIVGERRIVARIRPRDEARRIYEAARARGHVAGLLDQERPNIFTQSVTNIEPGATVIIEISYVETLQYEDGVFQFVFPMVVGPRYMPGHPSGRLGSGWSPDTTRVPDASRISPPVAPPGTRAGHDIRLSVEINAGMEILDLESELHDVIVHRPWRGRALVELKRKDEIPNKDFILRYRTATAGIGDAILSHSGPRGTFVTLFLQPPRRVRPEDAVAKEMIFVIDRSGSMSGYPIEKAKATMRLAIEQMNPNDTFNLLSFSGGTGRCFPRPVANTRENREIALRYLADLHGSGGTEMMKAIREALGGEHDPRRVRIVCFMTDGYIGNDLEIIGAVRKHAGTTRVFSFGIGNSVNRFLLDGMAHAGRGEVEYVTLESHSKGAATRFHERIHSPVLTDIEIDWGSLPVTGVYPSRFPDLFSNKPLLIHARLSGAASGSIVLRGNTAAGPFERTIEVNVSGDSNQGFGTGEEPERSGVLGSLWARAKIKDLTMRDYAALQSGNFPEEIEQEITRLGVDFSLMTRFTSFIAVEEMRITVGGEPTMIAVPVEMPDGVSYEGVFGPASQPLSLSVAGIAPKTHSISLRGRAGRAGASFFGGRAVRIENARENETASRDDAGFRNQGPAPSKLAEPLRGLAKKVGEDGSNGNLTLGDLKVVDYRVDVMIVLADLSEETLAALRELGFVQTGESKTMRLLIGTIDVRNLEALAELDSVRLVRPVAEAAMPREGVVLSR
ncbi:VWA domain-containing protein [Candidatus Sumerlaeota bacterium]|nr:VWA domain-containing protein [Candidatus Sumerlaeota bacterium]